MFFMTIYQLTERKTFHLKNNIDNGIILSLLSINLIDNYEYATYNEMVYSTSTGDKSSIDFRINTDLANRTSAQIAYKRFLKSLYYNVSVANFLDTIQDVNSIGVALPIKSNNIIKSVKLEKFVVYNIVNSNIYKIEKINNDFNITKLNSNSDYDIPYVSNIKNSSVYVKMTFEIYTYGNFTVQIPFEELVGVNEG